MKNVNAGKKQVAGEQLVIEAKRELNGMVGLLHLKMLCH